LTFFRLACNMAFYMANENYVTSLGSPGIPEPRSFGRWYLTADQLVNSFQQLQTRFQSLISKAPDYRRIVFRAEADADTSAKASQNGLPIEAHIPLSLVQPGNENHLLTLAHNAHIWPIDNDNWQTFEQDWRQNPLPTTQPAELVQNLNREKYSLTSFPLPADTTSLFNLWKMFGWSQEEVQRFISNFSTKLSIWFSAIRENATGEIASVCMAERININSIAMIELTEFATRPGHNGLNSIAVAGLTAQVVNDMHITQARNREKKLPVIVAELSLKARSDKVARKIGMTIPQSTLDNRLVLKHNVGIDDGLGDSSIDLTILPPEDRIRYAQAYAGHQYFRNFVMGVLPGNAIDAYYNLGAVNAILSCYN
jgi:hypothetical protein